MGAREGKGISFLALFHLVVKMDAYLKKNYSNHAQVVMYMYQGYNEKISSEGTEDFISNAIETNSATILPLGERQD